MGVAANVGLDLNATNSALVQYGAVQGSYNWDCCGFSVEVRKYELGSVRNETVERFNFTLSNIGTAGNLRRARSPFWDLGVGHPERWLPGVGGPPLAP